MGRRRRGEKVKKWGGDEGKEERSEADEERGRKRKRVIQVGYLSEVRRPGGKGEGEEVLLRRPYHEGCAARLRASWHKGSVMKGYVGRAC